MPRVHGSLPLPFAVAQYDLSKQASTEFLWYTHLHLHDKKGNKMLYIFFTLPLFIFKYFENPFLEQWAILGNEQCWASTREKVFYGTSHLVSVLMNAFCRLAQIEHWFRQQMHTNAAQRSENGKKSLWIDIRGLLIAKCLLPTPHPIPSHPRSLLSQVEQKI